MLIPVFSPVFYQYIENRKVQEWKFLPVYISSVIKKERVRGFSRNSSMIRFIKKLAIGRILFPTRPGADQKNIGGVVLAHLINSIRSARERVNLRYSGPIAFILKSQSALPKALQ